MIEKIKNFGSSGQSKSTDNTQSGATMPQNKKVSSSDALSTKKGRGQLNEAALKLESLKESVMSAPDLDEINVEKIKEQITKGEYKVGFGNLAKKMVKDFS